MDMLLTWAPFSSLGGNWLNAGESTVGISYSEENGEGKKSSRSFLLQRCARSRPSELTESNFHHPGLTQLTLCTSPEWPDFIKCPKGAFNFFQLSKLRPAWNPTQQNLLTGECFRGFQNVLLVYQLFHVCW